MKHDIFAVAIIPAKTDSTRLSKKNLQIVDGKTLLEHSIEYAKNSEYIKDIIVTTESKEVEEICKNYDDIKVYNRPKHLLKDAEVVDVYLDVVQEQFRIHQNFNVYHKMTHMVGIQPDHPDRTNNIDDMLDYFVDNTYDDLFTVDSKGTRNGSIRITKAQYVRKGTMSKRVGSMLDDCTNIHSEEDLRQAERNIQNNE